MSFFQKFTRPWSPPSLLLGLERPADEFARLSLSSNEVGCVALCVFMVWAGSVLRLPHLTVNDPKRIY